ncbi:hypothetical protein B5P43_13900 [Bacillus sp. SRB_336]|nr:hypothetical protein B5P43_13900 [Bacillus sp. SRB_336]
MTIALRPATTDDAEAVMTLHLCCREEAYGRHLPPEFFAMRRDTLPGRVANLRKAIAAGRAPLLAYDDEGLLGLSAGSPAQHPDEPVPVELYMLYILSRAYGGGAGQLLLDAVIGREAAFLWVLEDNPRAQAFYARNGFVMDGACDVLGDDWHNLAEVRMVWAAQPESAPAA